MRITEQPNNYLKRSFFWCNSLIILSFAVRLLPCKHGYENQSPKCRFLPKDNTEKWRKYKVYNSRTRKQIVCKLVNIIIRNVMKFIQLTSRPWPQRQFKTMQKKCKKGELVPSATHGIQRSIQNRTNMMLKYYRKSQTLRHGWTSELSLDKNL